MSELCPICKRPIDVVVTSYCRTPFVDGRRYDEMCFICASVPYRSFFTGEQWETDRLCICTVQEMIDHGWTKKEATVSIEAIKKLMKSEKILVETANGTNIFDTIFINDTIQRENVSHHK